MSWLKFKYHLGTSSKPRPFPSDIELEFEALRKERDDYREALESIQNGPCCLVCECHSCNAREVLAKYPKEKL